MYSIKSILKTAAISAALLLFPTVSFAQGNNYPQDLLKGKNYTKVTDLKSFDNANLKIRDYLRTLSNGVKVPIKVESAYTFKGNDSLYINFNRNVADYPIRPDGVKKIYSILKENLPTSLKGKKIAVFSAGSKLEYLVTPFYTEAGSRLNMQNDGRITVSPSEQRLKEQEGKPFSISKGLQDRHIAMQNSHGWFYEPTLDRWEFQRARLFGVVEDTYTMSYVEPFLVPMLENAGAVVLIPKERDWTKVEVIVDNDTQTNGYSISEGSYSWSKGEEPGFAHPKKSYVFGENPFLMGSYVQVEGLLSSKDQAEASSSLNESTITWTPSFEEDGDYAVYISYHTLPSSAERVSYTVKYSGGQTEFTVNQKMGGSMWIYLGTFHFKKGAADQGVTLTNAKSFGTVTADACKFGGGMGNIARGKGEGFVSGMPRFLEGARYYLQWSGFADSVYSSSRNENDYTDDYVSRGKYVNAIAGGSKVLRNWGGESRNIPLDLSFAFHTDAGNSLGDTIIGTLSIYSRTCKDFGGENLYPNGEDRILGRYLADIVQTQLVDDITDKYGFAWSRRQLWDRSYSESRSPQVPGMLLEFLSHHNYADMKFGLDPDFRFTASRAIYKGILKFLSMKNNVPYAVQPLPVNNMQVVFENPSKREVEVETEVEIPAKKATKGKKAQPARKVTKTVQASYDVMSEGDIYAVVSWSPVEDKLESTATPTGYVVYTAIDDNGYDQGTYTQEPKYRKKIDRDHIYRFKVTAVNDGGESFASEVVAVGVPSQRKSDDIVLVVNAFDRVGAPKWMQSKDSTIAGFFADYDHGVPYIKDASYLGKMYEYRRSVPWTDDDAPGFGACYNDQAGNVIAGNTFDYAYDHGLAFMHNGYAFISSTRSAVENGKTDMTRYSICDMIMGKQAQSNNGALTKLVKYHVYTPAMKKAITDFCAQGRNLILSGAYVATDLVDAYEVDKTEGPKFAADVLKIKWMTHSAAKDGRVSAVMNDYGFNGNFEFWSELNSKKYVCEAPDAFTPSGKDSYTIMRYPQTSISAAVAYPGKDYRTAVFGFPIETLKSQEQIDSLIGQTIDFFNRK